MLGAYGRRPAARLEEQRASIGKISIPANVFGIRDRESCALHSPQGPGSAVISAGVSNWGPLLCADTIPVNVLQSPFRMLLDLIPMIFRKATSSVCMRRDIIKKKVIGREERSNTFGYPLVPA